MSAVVAGSVIAVSGVLAVNAGVVAVGWANQRRQPKPTDRPYRRGTSSPGGYTILGVGLTLLVAIVGGIVLGVVADPG